MFLVQIVFLMHMTARQISTVFKKKNSSVHIKQITRAHYATYMYYAVVQANSLYPYAGW